MHESVKYECRAPGCGKVLQRACARATHEKYAHPNLEVEEVWENTERLKRLYENKRLSTFEIAGRLGCSPKQVERVLKDHGVKLRPRGASNRAKYASFRTDDRGYERWTASNGKYEKDRLRVHRLAAVAWFGFDAVAGNDVHHKNGVRWDNREENMVTVGHAKHAEIHAESRSRVRGDFV